MKPTNLCRCAQGAQKATVMVPSYFVRVFFLLVAWCTAALTMKTPSSVTAVMVENAGAAGAASAAVFCVAFLVLLADVIVNDFMPERFKLTCARDYRWLCISLMSTVYFLFGVLSLYPVAGPQGSWVITTFYFATAAYGIWFACWAKFRRYEQQLAVQNADNK